MLNDFRREAERFTDLNEAALARVEADDAEEYRRTRGRYPDGLSGRAWREIERRVAVELSHATSDGRSDDDGLTGPYSGAAGYRECGE